MKKLQSVICCIFCLLILSHAGFCALPASAALSKAKTSITQLTPKGNAFKVSWKTKRGIEGYQIQYSTSSKFTKSKTKTKTVKKAKTATATIQNLKGCNKKYYVRIRTYDVVKNKKVYSSWSKTKAVTTLKHKYTDATCTTAKTCKYCEKTSGEKLGHRWSAATCTTAKSCIRCSKTSGEKLGHKYTDTVTKPTCTTGGYTTHKCSVCKKSYTDTKVPAAGHSWGDWVTVNAPTENATGLARRTCSSCGSTETKTLDMVGHTHTYNITVDYKAPSCSAEGYETKACSCGKTKTETLSKEEHDWVRKHTDEVGHYDVKVVCHCGGWSCSADEDYISSFVAHLESIPIESRYDGHSYYDTTKWVVDVPAKDWEECSACGTAK